MEEDGTGPPAQAADAQAVVADYAAFVGALQRSLCGGWTRRVVEAKARTVPRVLGERGGWSLVHAQVFGHNLWLVSQHDKT
jgi:hypothetical protein